jgi:hypothetical protein
MSGSNDRKCRQEGNLKLTNSSSSSTNPGNLEAIHNTQTQFRDSATTRGEPQDPPHRYVGGGGCFELVTYPQLLTRLSCGMINQGREEAVWGCGFWFVVQNIHIVAVFVCVKRAKEVKRDQKSMLIGQNYSNRNHDYSCVNFGSVPDKYTGCSR